jgi:hypothetical protein
MRIGTRCLGIVLVALMAEACVVRHAGGWQLLGRREVDFGRDRDRIELGRGAGRFAELKFTVRGGDIELYDVKVSFGDGSFYHPDTRVSFRDGSESRVINLPGERRVLRGVEFFYRSTSRREGRATLSLFGR